MLIGGSVGVLLRSSMTLVRGTHGSRTSGRGPDRRRLTVRGRGVSGLAVDGGVATCGESGSGSGTAAGDGEIGNEGSIVKSRNECDPKRSRPFAAWDARLSHQALQLGPEPLYRPSTQHPHNSPSP
jgi:hypothetical protein